MQHPESESDRGLKDYCRQMSATAKEQKPRVPRQKNMTDPYQVAEAMLQKTIELPIHDILSLSQPLQHVFFGSWPDPNQERPAARVSNMSAVVNPELLRGDSVRFADKLYTAASPKTLTSVMGKSVQALLDSGAEMNVMSRSLAQILGRHISENVALNMLAPEGKESRFTRLCANVEVSIG